MVPRRARCQHVELTHDYTTERSSFLTGTLRILMSLPWRVAVRPVSRAASVCDVLGFLACLLSLVSALRGVDCRHCLWHSVGAPQSPSSTFVLVPRGRDEAVSKATPACE